MNKKPRQAARRGFTLIEIAVATVIIGLAAVALMTALAASTKVNGSGKDLTQASYLAQEIREWTLNLPFADLDDLADYTYSPPKDATGADIAGMDGWAQHVTVTWRNPQDLSSVVVSGSSNVAYVSVDVTHAGNDVFHAGWLVIRGE